MLRLLLSGCQRPVRGIKKEPGVLWISRLWKGIYKQLCGALRQQWKCDIILEGVAIRLAVIPYFVYHHCNKKVAARPCKDSGYFS